MNILMVHSYYQHRGGEDTVFEEEFKLLEKYEKKVVKLAISNSAIVSKSKLAPLLKLIWNHTIYTDIKKIVREERIEIVHFHNIFPFIGFAGLIGAKHAGAKTYLTVHNYRLQCIKGTFFRDGKICTLCNGKKFPLAAVKYKCYQDKYTSSSIALILRSLNLLIPQARYVDQYIALNLFMKDFIAKSMKGKAEITIKPNFLEDLDLKDRFSEGYCLYVGRISEEKGIVELSRIWKSAAINKRLVIIGSGNLDIDIEAGENILFLGKKDKYEVIDILERAEVLIFPSQWYEGMPMVIIEAFRSGIPVIIDEKCKASSMIEDGVDGFVGNLLDPGDLTRTILRLSNSDRNQLRKSARAAYEKNYTPENNMKIFEEMYSNDKP